MGLMTSERRESLGRWIGGLFTLRDLLQLVILAVTVVGGYFTLQTRITILETLRIQDQDRYNREVSKIVEKVDTLNSKVDDANTSLQVVKSQLNDYGPNSYVYRPYKGAAPGTVRKH
jgi:uncharacterized protein YlxW (UPF0749 family)